MKKKETFISKYMEFELLEGRSPHSVLEFCKTNKTPETDFYKHFSSLNQLRKAIVESTVNETIQVLNADENYASFSAKEQGLALFYTLFEELKEHRSYFLAKYAHLQNLKDGWKDWDDFFRQFDARMEQIILHAKENHEVTDRPLIGNYYAKSFRLTFTYVFRVWLKDESKAFETTDAAIEKSVNLAFELLSQGPLDRIIDFGRFAIKTKFI